MLVQGYVATVQIMVLAKNQDEANEVFQSLLTQGAMHEGTIFDWGYLKVGGQYLYPTERVLDISEDAEGEFQK